MTTTLSSYLVTGMTSSSEASATTTVTITTTEFSSPFHPSPVALMTTSSNLSLQLNLNNSIVQNGNNVSLQLKMSNLLSVANSIPSNSSWTIPGLVWPPPNCNHVLYPIGLAVFKGTYTQGNIRNATYLHLWNTGTTFCPSLGEVGAWVFQPSSDIASSGITSDTHLETNFSAGGYWTGGDNFGNGATYSRFGPGPYTVAAGDEWGDLLLLTFQVV